MVIKGVVRHVLSPLGLLAVLVMQGCNDPSANLDQGGCPADPGGSSWIPNVVASNGEISGGNQHNAQVKIFRDYYVSYPGYVTGASEATTAQGHVLTVDNIEMNTDLLSRGSLSLVAEPAIGDEGVESTESVWPVLVSLTDGVHEWVNLQGCEQGFFKSCTAEGCTYKPGCGPRAPSAFSGNTDAERLQHWEQSQNIMTDNQFSVNQFPTCNWAALGSYDCAFNSNFFVGPTSPNDKLPTGTYTAKYVLLSDKNTELGTSQPATVKLSVVRKQDASASGDRQAIDLNVILVGSRNIADSRTAKGQQNLNALFQHVYDHYAGGNPSVGVQLGNIKVYEWDCARGGDAFADAPDVGQLFQLGSGKMPMKTEGSAINIFLTSSIMGDQSYLGIAGGIPGPMINGTTGSGVVFATSDQLATFNPNCRADGFCTTSRQEPEFIDMGSTISHEMGHFLGLNHPNEADGVIEDYLSDTPTCHMTSTTALGRVITQSSCWNEAASSCKAKCAGYNGVDAFCPAVSECQFNHVMWWAGKNYAQDGSGQGDGNIFSTFSGILMNYSPYVQ